MVQEYMLYGIREQVYYATKQKNNEGRTTIRRLIFNPKFAKGVVNERVYEMTSRVVAMEVRNYSDVVISGTEDSEELRNKFTDEILFILDDQQMVHQLEFSTVKKPNRVIFHDYTKFDLKAVIDNDWSSCHIGTETLVYNEITYRAIPDSSRWRRLEALAQLL